MIIRPSFHFTELAIDLMRPGTHDRKHRLNRNPVPLGLLAGFVWATTGAVKLRYGRWWDGGARRFRIAGKLRPALIDVFADCSFSRREGLHCGAVY